MTELVAGGATSSRMQSTARAVCQCLDVLQGTQLAYVSNHAKRLCNAHANLPMRMADVQGVLPGQQNRGKGPNAASKRKGWMKPTKTKLANQVRHIRNSASRVKQNKVCRS